MECAPIPSNNYYNDNNVELGCTYGSEESYVIKRKSIECGLYIIKNVKGHMVETEFGQNYFSADKQLVTLSLKEKSLKCGEEVYQTDQDGIYAIAIGTIAAENIQLRHEKMSHMAKVQVDQRIRIHATYQKLETS